MSIRKHNQSTILIVDDKAENLNVLMKVLMGADFKVLVKKNGEGALELALRKKPI